MASSQGDMPSSLNHTSSARHTPVASPAQGLNDYNTSSDFSSHANDYNNNSNNSASSQSLFNSQFDFSVADQSLFTDHQFQQTDQSAFPEFVNFDTNTGQSFDGSLNGSFNNNSSFIESSIVDPTLLDPQVSSQSILAQMATSNQAPTPPHLLASNIHRNSLSPRDSPANSNLQYTSPPGNHARHESLDPSSAAFPQGQIGDWGGSAQFQGHRRTLSDAHSDISSAQQSPYNQPLDDFNHALSHSPNLQATDPVMFQDFGIGGVSLSEAQNYITPSHSPHISPSISPNHHNVSAFPHMENINLGGPLNGNSPGFFDPSQMQNMPAQGPAFDFSNYTTIKQETPGQADAMSPPEISIQFAPPSRQASFEPQGQKPPSESGGLNLPERRGRAKSDPSARGSSATKDLLSPHAAGVGSRSPSPSNKSRRSSTSSVPHRDYILTLADPDRPASSSSETGSAAKRTQKHPANFQCSLCPKRFTRAYNLRSHLRTHTDERPFVCSHCGKAFARQHDRKRHEGLHSGEKKFECRGSLKDGNNWGCGRRFARADALGRHFRSEAGRICIKPLMDEEARERSQEDPEPGTDLGIPIMPMPNQQLGMGQQGQAGYYGVPNQNMFQQGMSAPQFPLRLPTALLQQYPTLQGIWDTLPANGPDEADEGISGRSSYDASSAGEFDDDDQWHEGEQQAAFGWASDVGP